MDQISDPRQASSQYKQISHEQSTVTKFPKCGAGSGSSILNNEHVGPHNSCNGDLDETCFAGSGDRCTIWQDKLHAAPAAANSVSAVLSAFSLATATPNQAQSQPQNKAAPAPTYEYEAATIKPSKGPGPDHKIGMWAAPDGFSAWFVTSQQMISMAYGV